MSATVDAQRRILRTLNEGDSVAVRDTSRSGTTYYVLGVTGDKAIEARLIGEHGARRTLVDGLNVVWMRSQTARGPRHRRVLSLSVNGRPDRPETAMVRELGVQDGFRECARRLARIGDQGESTAAPEADGAVDHPSHYGGDTVYETINVIEAWGLGFHLGNAVKYISRAGRKSAETEVEDLEKARWYLEREISRLRGTS